MKMPTEEQAKDALLFGALVGLLVAYASGCGFCLAKKTEGGFTLIGFGNGCAQ